jgi:hypothetical protein
MIIVGCEILSGVAEQVRELMRRMMATAGKLRVSLEVEFG